MNTPRIGYSFRETDLHRRPRQVPFWLLATILLVAHATVVGGYLWIRMG